MKRNIKDFTEENMPYEPPVGLMLGVYCRPTAYEFR